MLFTAHQQAIRIGLRDIVNPSVHLSACLAHAGVVSK